MGAVLISLGVVGLDMMDNKLELTEFGLNAFSIPPLLSRPRIKLRKNLILTFPWLIKRRPTLPKSSWMFFFAASALDSANKTSLIEISTVSRLKGLSLEILEKFSGTIGIWPGDMGEIATAFGYAIIINYLVYAAWWHAESVFVLIFLRARRQDVGW